MIGILASCWLALCSASAHSQDTQRLRHEFEAELVSWQVSSPLQSRLTDHRRISEDRANGQRCEQLLFQSAGIVPDQIILHRLPEARIFDELTLTIRVRSNCPNLRLGIQILFPHQIDPRTGELLTLELYGDRYTGAPDWQQLTCRASDLAVQQRLVRARQELSNGVDPVQIDTRDMLVRAAVLKFDLPGQASGLRIDDLELGPIIPPSEQIRRVIPATASTPEIPPGKLLITDRVFRDQTPFFPLFTIHHGEPVEQLARLGVNLLWVADYRDTELLTKLHQAHLGVLAVPPQPARDEALYRSAQLPTFPVTTSPVWAWMLGADIPAEERAFVEAWAGQVRLADREFRRPIMGEVRSDQRAFHRSLNFMGSARIPLQTPLHPPEVLKRAQRYRDLALPGKANFLFIDLEPPTASPSVSLGDEQPRIFEPEQILMQVDAALAAGYRGLGFWKQIPFTDSRTGLNEREHAVRLACIKARLLEPLLAGSRTIREISVQMGNEDSKKLGKLGGNHPFASRWDSVLLASGEVANPRSQSRDLRAFLMQSDAGFLILPVWLEENAQFVPDLRIARHVHLLLPPGITSAWDVSTTGIKSQIRLTPVAGGTEAYLEELSLFSAIVATHNRETLDQLRDRSRQFRATAAESWLALTAAKYQRTRDIHAELSSLKAPPIADATASFQSVEALLTRARKSLDNDDFDGVRRDCERALQYLRSVQRQHWLMATQDLTSPVSVPPAVSFQTLPAYWKLLAEIGRRNQRTGNLLDTGSFEDEGSFRAAGWQVTVPAPDEVFRQRAGLDPVGVVGRTALVLETSRQQEGSTPLLQVPPAVEVRSPEIAIEPGDIVLITGKIRIPQPLSTGDDGCLFYDSLGGPGLGLRWTRQTQGWESFRLIRQAPMGGTLSLNFSLQALGRVELDDLQVISLVHDDSSPP